jgi:hypothetical protein
MSGPSGVPGYRPGRLRLAALSAVIAGVAVLAAAAFVFSYSGVRQIALATGVTAALARLYPLIFDAMLVTALAAVLALRGAAWWARLYSWLCLIILLASVAAADAVHAMAVALPRELSRAAVAVTPWALVLLAFGLLLAMLRHLRRERDGVGPAAREPDAGAEQRGADTTQPAGEIQAAGNDQPAGDSRAAGNEQRGADTTQPAGETQAGRLSEPVPDAAWETGLQDDYEPVLPAPTPVPPFERLRSSPVPPDDDRNQPGEPAGP